MPEENGQKPRAAQPTSFWLDDRTKDVLDRLTQELQMNRSAVVREAIRRMAAQDQNSEVRRLVAQLQRVVGGG